MFGENGGFVFGIELAVVILDKDSPAAWGISVRF
jgi:hypothetical protein